MKPLLLIALALLCVGCSDKAAEKSEAIPKHWSQTARDSIEYYYIFKDGELVDNCDQMRDFAAWCQKAYPAVWREYDSCIVGLHNPSAEEVDSIVAGVLQDAN